MAHGTFPVLVVTSCYMTLSLESSTFGESRDHTESSVEDGLHPGGVTLSAGPAGQGLSL